MPIYEYTCLACGTDFEKLVRKAEDTRELKCPVCGDDEVEEKVSACASFVKGGTFGTSGTCAPTGG